MKIEDIWMAWKVDPTLKDYLIFFMPPRQLFYRAYETDAEALSYILGFKVVAQGTTKYAGFPRESGKKYFSLLKNAGYSFIVVQDKEGNGSWKPILKNSGNKSLDIKIPTTTINDFKRELNTITRNEYNTTEVSFREFSQTLNEIEELIKKYRLIPNILTPQIVNDKIPVLDFSNVKSDIDDIDDLDDDTSLDFQNNSKI